MGRGLIILLVLLGVLFFWGIGVRNGFATKKQNVEQAVSEVDNQYKRRYDLINKLVKTVQGSADFEKSTLTEVINARAKATSINLNAGDLTPEKMQQFEAAQAQLSGALSRLMAVAENYPQLRSTQAFSELQASIEGTETRIAVARRDYNGAVRDYNGSLVTFPNSLIAGFTGFQQMAYFQASETERQDPEVEFDFGNKERK